MFVDEHYEKVEKVYSIWICPDPAKKRKNGIFKYHTIEDIIYGEPYAKEENYDLMEVVVLNLGDVDKSSDLAILDLLNVLFSTTTTLEEKKQRKSYSGLKWSRCQCHYLQHSRDSPFKWIKTLSLLNVCIRETPPAWTIPKARGTGQLTSMGRRTAGRNKEKN